MSLRSEVRLHGGVPTLFADGVPLTGPAYVTYMPEREDYAAFARMGHKLYSVCVYFATRPISSAELYKPFMPGVFTAHLIDPFLQIRLHLCVIDFR